MTQAQIAALGLGRISTCQPGQEKHERYWSTILKAWRVQYEYRRLGGDLFTCVSKSLAGARARRDNWLAEGRP